MNAHSHFALSCETRRETIRLSHAFVGLGVTEQPVIASSINQSLPVFLHASTMLLVFTIQSLSSLSPCETNIFQSLKKDGLIRLWLCHRYFFQ